MRCRTLCRREVIRLLLVKETVLSLSLPTLTMNIVDLPEDVLVNIFKQCDERSLRQFCLSNSLFHDIIFDRVPAVAYEVNSI